AARRPGSQAQIQLTLPSRQPLPRDRLQQLQLGLIVSRADVLDLPRPAMRGVHDLNGHRPRRCPDRPHVRHSPTLRSALRLVRRFRTAPEQTRRSENYSPSEPATLIKVRSGVSQRPYVLLSCATAIDGYIDDTSSDRPDFYQVSAHFVLATL